ncbi:MAG: hypothetical protein K2G12_07580 [Prevotella sp.]|nr:hypothetical protein [Prevotella sp.]
MKKVLFSLLFLLNLQVIADYIGIPLGDNALHAQNYSNEGYYDCYDDGEWYASSLPCDMEACVAACTKCHERFPCSETHYCTYVPPGTSGENITWDMDYDDNEEDHEINHDFATGGGGSTSGNNDLISVRDLKLNSKVKLINYMTLPNVLHKQTLGYECVVRAIAFLSELDGHNYDNAYKILKALAEKAKYNLNERGIDLCDIHRIFESYCNIVVNNYDYQTIEHYIDHNKPVAAITLTQPCHMAVIIGYDDNFYYTAAGYSKAKIYQKGLLGNENVIYLFTNIKSPYKCKRKTY